ncbi:MAG: TlpA family protein disulfide reductase [Anaerolineae bacterium]|nr:TlpA family protein disulfide reductase [Anaerolineae bacterium]
MLLIVNTGNTTHSTKPAVSSRLAATPLPAPDDVLTKLDGGTFQLSDFLGKLVIVSFWATWCPPCLEEMPLLQQLAATHPEIPFVAITDSDDGQTVEGIQKFMSEYGLTHLEFGLDPSRRLFNAFGVVSIPMTFVLDQAGVVRFRKLGTLTEKDMNFYMIELGEADSGGTINGKKGVAP